MTGGVTRLQDADLPPRSPFRRGGRTIRKGVAAILLAVAADPGLASAQNTDAAGSVRIEEPVGNTIVFDLATHVIVESPALYLERSHKNDASLVDAPLAYLATYRIVRTKCRDCVANQGDGSLATAPVWNITVEAVDTKKHQPPTNGLFHPAAYTPGSRGILSIAPSAQAGEIESIYLLVKQLN